MNDNTRISSALLVSILLHAAAAGLLSGLATIRTSLPSPPLLDVDLVSLPVPAKKQKIPPPPEPKIPAEAIPEKPAPEPPTTEPVKQQPPPRSLPLPEQQIVSPSEGGEEKPPENTRFLSDRDSTVKEQSIRRGEPAPGSEHKPKPVQKVERSGGSVKEKASAVRERVASAPTEMASVRKLPGLSELLPSASQLASEGMGKEEKPKAPAEGEPGERADLLKYGDAWHAATTRPGALDFLPDVREGDITLLNTKAELFSPFVRRVALRVFGHLVILLRRDLEQVATSNREWVTIEALMSKGGDLLSLQLKERSTSSSMNLDRSLQRACHEGFFDRNPPGGAEAADGNIHFLLHTRVTTVAGPDGRPIGYNALFSAGLL